jgi:TonB family protein
MSEVWTKWEGQAINGVFPLRRLLSASDHSAIFLTEYKAQNLLNAALKLVPAIPTRAQAQLSQWTNAATLSHPHLIRLFEAGRCELGGLPFLFVVLEYAEQTLSQILPRRALTPDEVREMLLPTLNALAFLHGKNLVQGRLTPSNILVVNDRLKLASDTVRPAGESTASIAKSSVYDPPEAQHGSYSAAGDIWGLGITMVEALTQHPPSWPDSKSETVSFPAALPPTFAAIARQCLNRDPANRPAVADLEAQITAAAQLPVVSLPPPKRRLFVPAIAGLVIAAVAVWAGVHALRSRTSLERVAPSTAASQNPETSLSAPPVSAPQPAQPLANGSASVLHEEIPDVPRRARNTIHGQIKIAVRVTVDRSGNVVAEALENPGPSRYFARLATTAARKWKFAPADNQAARKWLLRFEFTRGGATGYADSSRRP